MQLIILRTNKDISFWQNSQDIARERGVYLVLLRLRKLFMVVETAWTFLLHEPDYTSGHRLCKGQKSTYLLKGQ